jgi:hypothetical protein
MKLSMIVAVSVMAVVAVCLAGAGVASANVITLEFNANDVFNYAAEDGLLLDQGVLGMARKIWDCPTGRAYRTYSDGPRDSGATAAQDLQSVANIQSYVAEVGFQGVSHVQLWLCGNAAYWGEKVLMKPNTTLSASVNGEGSWTGFTEAKSDQPGYSLAHYNTVLGGSEAEWNAISLDVNPADEVWSVTGDFYVDNDGSNTYNTGDTDLVVGTEYPIWFNAANNNWLCEDAYNNSGDDALWGGPDIQGTLMATATPEPATMALLAAGGIATLLRRRRSSK